MLDKSLALRYANALMKCAKDQAIQQTVLAELAQVREAIIQKHDLEIVFDHPEIPADEKKELATAVFGKSLSPMTLAFVQLLVDKKRMNYLPLIYDTFKTLFNKDNNILPVTVTSFGVLSTADQKTLQKKLEETLGKTVTLTVAQDAALMGGCKIGFGGEVIDGSVAYQLKQLKEKILMG